MWFTEAQGSRIGKITPSGAVTEFSAGIPAGSYLVDIARGPDGNMWFTHGDSVGPWIGRITPTGTVTQFSAGITGSGLFGIAAGPDGNMWFTESLSDRIGRIGPLVDDLQIQGVTEIADPVAEVRPLRGGDLAGRDVRESVRPRRDRGRRHLYVAHRPQPARARVLVRAVRRRRLPGLRNYSSAGDRPSGERGSRRTRQGPTLTASRQSPAPAPPRPSRAASRRLPAARRGSCASTP